MKLHLEPFFLVQRWFLKIWTGQYHGLRSYRRRLLQLVRGMGLQRIWHLVKWTGVQPEDLRSR